MKNFKKNEKVKNPWFRNKREPLEFEELRNYGDMFTLKEFVACCKSGGFIDYDGYGYYAFKDKQSNKFVAPSHIKKGKIDRRFTHVMWYNR